MSDVKSRPVYQPLAADPTGRSHILVGVGERAAASLATVLEELSSCFEGRTMHIQVFLSGCVLGPDRGLKRSEGEQCFEDTASLLVHLEAALQRSLMGTRLYIAGPESFIGRALGIASEFNLAKDEVRAEHVGSGARRVRCVHCRADNEDVRHNLARCVGCGRWLSVRDHYSRRYAAYMGVMADAEVPGELPEVHEVHR